MSGQKTSQNSDIGFENGHIDVSVKVFSLGHEIVNFAEFRIITCENKIYFFIGVEDVVNE